MDLGLHAKKAVIVGGARGIGLATAEVLVKEGCHVAIGARSAERVSAAIAKLPKSSGTIWGGAVDVTDAAAYSQWLAAAVAALGGIDILVLMQSASGGLSVEDKWRGTFEVDVVGSVRACEFAVPKMAAAGGGSIVLVASTAALETFIAPQAFNALKASLITYGKQLSQAVAKDKVRVNVVSPGPVEFQDGNWLKIKSGRPELYESTLKQLPSGRMGRPDEVANAVAFLASHAASWITGVNLVVDGGFTKRVAF